MAKKMTGKERLLKVLKKYCDINDPTQEELLRKSFEKETDEDALKRSRRVEKLFKGLKAIEDWLKKELKKSNKKKK